ncbi:MAG: hypothetical protein ACFFCQ_06055, partial [Promethearchaeota archaeon]
VEKLSIPQEFTSVSACVVISIDNFGLAEIVNFKPAFLIQFMQRIILLDTTHPDAESITSYTVYGRATPDPFAPNLFTYLMENNLTVHIVDRQEFMDRHVPDHSINRTVVTQDMQAWTAATKALNRNHLVFVRFTDLDLMYQRYAGIQAPAEIVKKGLDRTSNWLKILFKQAIAGTVFLVIGNHGTETTKDLDYGERGRQAEWRKANVPIGLLSLKTESS